MLERNLPRIVGDDAVVGLDDRRIRAIDHHMNLRRQGQGIALPRVFHAHGPPGGLWSSKFDPRRSHGVSAVFVEDEIACLQVDRILEFFGRGLIGTAEPGRVGDQIDLHVALGSDVASFLVESKIVAIDLVETRRVAPIQHDADVVQLGVAPQFEFFDITGLDGEQGALAVRLGKLKSARRSLDVVSDLAGDLL